MQTFAKLPLPIVFNSRYRPICGSSAAREREPADREDVVVMNAPRDEPSAAEKSAARPSRGVDAAV